MTVAATGCTGAGSWGAPTTNWFAWGKSDAASQPAPPSMSSHPSATATAANNTSSPSISIPGTPSGAPETPPGGGPGAGPDAGYGGGGIPGGGPAGGYAATDPSTYAPTMPGEAQLGGAYGAGGPRDTGPIGGQAGVNAQSGFYQESRPGAAANAYNTADARNAAGSYGAGAGGYSPPPTGSSYNPNAQAAPQGGGYPAGDQYPAAGAYQPANNGAYQPANNGGFQPGGGAPAGGGYNQTPGAGQGYSAPPQNQGGYSYPAAGGDYSNNTTLNNDSQVSHELLGKGGGAGALAANYDNTTAIGDSPSTGGAPPAALLQAAGGFRPGSTSVSGMSQVSPAAHQQPPQQSEAVRQASFDNGGASNGGQFQPQGGSFNGGRF